MDMNHVVERVGVIPVDARQCRTGIELIILLLYSLCKIDTSHQICQEPAHVVLGSKKLEGEGSQRPSVNKTTSFSIYMSILHVHPA